MKNIKKGIKKPTIGINPAINVRIVKKVWYNIFRIEIKMPLAISRINCSISNGYVFPLRIFSVFSDKYAKTGESKISTIYPPINANMRKYRILKTTHINQYSTKGIQDSSGFELKPMISESQVNKTSDSPATKAYPPQNKRMFKASGKAKYNQSQEVKSSSIALK